MAVTKNNVNGAFYFTYPSSDVFLKERNYFVFEGIEDDTYIKTVKIGDKTLNFGRYALDIGAKFYLDVSAYYAKYFGKFNVVITYENYREEVVTNTTAISAITFDCYSPFKEFSIPEPCIDTQYARITPPNRMLWDGEKSVTSMFAAMRKNDGYAWSINGTAYDVGMTYTYVKIGAGGFLAEYKFSGTLVNTIKRSIELIDDFREYVYMRWKTPWGYSVEHLFYLDTFGADKDNEKELESAPLNYSQRYDYVRKGSIYMDNIRDPYDLFYYKTLETAEVVEIWTPSFNVLPSFYMPDGTAYEAVKITGSNIKDAVVDGVVQSTITFDFELR